MQELECFWDYEECVHLYRVQGLHWVWESLKLQYNKKGLISRRLSVKLVMKKNYLLHIPLSIQYLHLNCRKLECFWDYEECEHLYRVQGLHWVWESLKLLYNKKC